VHSTSEPDGAEQLTPARNPISPAKLPVLPDAEVAARPAGSTSRTTTGAPDPDASPSPRFEALSTSVPLPPGERLDGIDSESSCHHGTAAPAPEAKTEQQTTNAAHTPTAPTRVLRVQRAFLTVPTAITPEPFH
jgi:hypothetical protein